MARVTVAEVQEIFDTDLTSAQISAFIIVAGVLTDKVSLATPALDATTLKEIERWLAAHFADIRDPIGLRVKLGEGEQWSFPASVTTAWGTGLRLTPYGQQAIVLDSTGTLANLGKQKAKFRSSPREDSDNFTNYLTKA